MRSGAPQWVTAALAALCLSVANQSHAADCPAFYRFVDFGLQDNAGQTYRGGRIMRVEGFDGRQLMQPDQSLCLPVRDTLTDGHGNPMPVVARIGYDPSATGLDLQALQVFAADSMAETAGTAAQPHRSSLALAQTRVTKGTDHLCASPVQGGRVSCQVASPFDPQYPLVVYCEVGVCRMQVMVLDAQLGVFAAWPQSATDPEVIGGDIVKTVAGIAAFLRPLSAGL